MAAHALAVVYRANVLQSEQSHVPVRPKKSGGLQSWSWLISASMERRCDGSSTRESAAFDPISSPVPATIFVHAAATFVGLKSLMERQPDPWT